jgi:hypothetical protein
LTCLDASQRVVGILFPAADAITRSECALDRAGDTLGKVRTSRPVSRDLIDEGWISGHCGFIRTYARSTAQASVTPY